MPKLNLAAMAAALPQSWRSQIVGETGQANIKVLRMDATAYPEEVHDHNEALLVLDGMLELIVAGERHTVRSGELYMVNAHVPHAVSSGSHGTLLIVDAMSPH